MINTIIELFDICQIENMVSCLRLLPERIVFVGYKEFMTNKRKQDIESFLAMRNIDIEIEYEIVGRYNFDMIVDRRHGITSLKNMSGLKKNLLCLQIFWKSL